MDVFYYNPIPYPTAKTSSAREKIIPIKKTSSEKEERLRGKSAASTSHYEAIDPQDWDFQVDFSSEES
jgi:hypothetical protein